jgi:hypothetical protein
VVTRTEFTAGTLQMRRRAADYRATMASRWSIVALLGAVIALLGLPASASAFSFAHPFQAQSLAPAATDCVDPDTPPPPGNPDVTPPTNTTAAAPAGWLTTAYVVALTGTDDTALDHMQWCVDGGTAGNLIPGQSITLDTSGEYTLITRAVDAAGNASPWRVETVSVDLEAPTDVTDPGTVAWTPTSPRQVTVSAIDSVSGVDHIEWQLDNGVVHSDVNNTTVTIAADGAHTLHTWAVDVAGSRSARRDHTINIDTVIPSDETAASAGWHNVSPVPVTVTGADAHSGIKQVTYKIDSGAETTVTAASAVANVSGDGNHTLYTKVMDRAGNETGWKASPINIDTTAPANQTPLPSAGWRGSDYAVIVSGADGGSGLHHVEWKVDGGPVTSGGPTVQATVAGNGTHTLSTRVLDVAGNASGWRDDTVNIDKVVPVNTTTPAPSSPVGNNYVVTVSGTDTPSGVDHVDWQLDPPNPADIQTFQSGPSGSTTTISGQGEHILASRVVDQAGNRSAWRLDHITVDAISGDSFPPVDTTTTAPAGWQPGGSIVVTVSATDADSGVAWLKWRLDGQPVATTTDDAVQLTISGDGDHTLETMAGDNAGRSTGWREQHFKIDGTLPGDDTVVPSGWSHSRTVTLAGHDDVSDIQEIEYRIGDTGPFLHGTVAQVLDLGGDGTFKVWHRAIDLAGNATPRVASVLKVDTVLPANTSAVPASAWSTAPLSLDLTGTDAGSGLDEMRWRVDGGDVQDGGPAVVDTDGLHTLETQAVDVAGNESAWRSDTVRIDLIAPVDTTPAAPAGWRSAPYDVTVTGDDGAGSGVATIDVKVDGVSSGPSVHVSGDGVHTIETQITDVVGHQSALRTDTIRIDSVIPTATLSCTAAWTRTASCVPTATGGPSGLASLTLARDGGAPSAVTSGHAVAVSVAGVHTLRLAAVDGAGNEKTVTASVKVDRVAPTASLSCVAAATPTGYTCRAAGADTQSGLSSLAYSVNGGAGTTVPASRTFTVASGTVRVRALDMAGNQTLTSLLTLTVRKLPVVTPPVTLRTANVPVYLAGHSDSGSLIGALLAARSANGTVSVDLRPLAVGRGRYQVQIALKSGKHKRTVKKAYTVGRGGTLPRIAASLAGATGKTTVTLTVRKKAGSSWRKHAGAKVVLAK